MLELLRIGELVSGDEEEHRQRHKQQVDIVERLLGRCRNREGAQIPVGERDAQIARTTPQLIHGE